MNRHAMVGILSLGLSLSASAAERSVSVTGTCTRQASSDRGAIIVTAEVTDSDLRQAAKKATEIYERVREAVKRLKLGDQDLRTSEYQVQELREWEKDRQVSKGFRARMGLRVASSDIQRLGEVISIASREGVRDVGSLQTFLSEEKFRAEQFACLQAAAENARAKAERLASSLKASVGEVLTLHEQFTPEDSPQPRPMAEMTMMKSRASDMAPPSIEGGRQDITATVQAVFKLN